METRTQYVTTVRGLVRAAGKKLGGCATENFVARFRKAQFDEALADQCQPLLLVLTTLEEQLAQVDGKLEQLAAHHPISRLLMTGHRRGLGHFADVPVGSR